ncbi:MAG: cell envelope integrity protein TolA [Desulfobacteraceae bacterium]|nr:cell envelope integrity protein TolA [Desulfobacteraceae bacterium]
MGAVLISRDKGGTFIGPDYEGRSLGLGSFGVSILLHIGLLLLMTFMQQNISFNKKMPLAVQVDLVSYSPKLEDILKSQTKQSKKISTKKPDVRLKPKSVKKSVEKPVEKKIEPIKIKKKDIVKEKEPEPAEIVEAAKEDVKERVEDQEQEKIRDLLAEMREKVAEQEMYHDYEKEEVTQKSGYRAWKKDITAINIYNGMFSTMIQQNWVFNERLAQLEKIDKKINVLVMIKIMKNGDLGDIWIETKSGNDFLDKSAERAIKKAAPFPPLPPEFPYSSYEVGLLFSPKGLN